MSSSLHRRSSLRESSSFRSVWLGRLIVSLTALVWIALGGAIFWIVGHAIGAVILLCIAAILAYAIFPLVKILQRILPRPIAILIVYVVILSGLCFLIYFTAISTVAQLNALIPFLQALYQPGKPSPIQPFLDLLNTLGFTREELVQSIQQVIAQLRSIINDIVPLLNNLFTIFLNIVLITTLSVYFLLDGVRVSAWLHKKTPLAYREHVSFLVDTVAKTVGGYIRGTIILNALFAVITGIGLGLLGVPDPFLLAVLTFFLAFIPIVGAYFVTAICLLFALPVGWITVVLTLIFLTLLQGVLIRQILGPRIIGQAVGIHPIVAIFALLAGGELFGLLGALFAVPIAGVIQALLLALWFTWRTNHPGQFPQEDDAVKNPAIL